MLETCRLSRCVSLLQDEDEEVYKRDFSAPTLEDHFNKTILPKVMQVGVLARGCLARLLRQGVAVPQREQGGAAAPHILPGRLLTSSSAPQVKNFGRSGRTKYTHLVDQDTTSFDSAWGQESAQNTKFFKQKAAGVRDVFERPSAKKRKTT